MKTILLVDGQNFKGKIRSVFEENGKGKPVWDSFDFKKLIELVLKDITINEKVFYFGKIKEDERTIEKSKLLIEEQRLLKNHLENQGFMVVLSGRVRGQLEENHLHKGKQVLIFKEKGVDVKIAVDIISMACDKKVETIILGSSDSDLQPAISEARKRGVELIYLGFENQPNKGMTFTTNRTILIRNSEILECEKTNVLF